MNTGDIVAIFVLAIFGVLILGLIIWGEKNSNAKSDARFKDCIEREIDPLWCYDVAK